MSLFQKLKAWAEFADISTPAGCDRILQLFNQNRDREIYGENQTDLIEIPLTAEEISKMSFYDELGRQAAREMQGK